MNAIQLRHNPLSETRTQYNSIKKHPIYIVCEGIQDTYNVGSIYRLGDALNVSEIILIGDCPKPDDKQVLKSSMFLSQVMRTSNYSTIVDCLNARRSDFKTVVALELSDRSLDYRDVNLGALNEGIAIIVGHVEPKQGGCDMGFLSGV